VYWKCRRFRHLVQNCRNKKEEMKGKLILQNKFKIIASRVMQCEVKEEVQVRRQKMAEIGVQCFRCWKMGYYKWECPNIKIKKKKKRRKSKEAMYVVSPQKIQQERRPVYSL